MACALRRYGVTDSDGNHGGSTWSEIDADHQPITDHAMAQDDRRRDAILDRLLHNSHKLKLKGESMRKMMSEIDHSDC